MIFRENLTYSDIEVLWDIKLIDSNLQVKCYLQVYYRMVDFKNSLPSYETVTIDDTRIGTKWIKFQKVQQYQSLLRSVFFETNRGFTKWEKIQEALYITELLRVAEMTRYIWNLIQFLDVFQKASENQFCIVLYWRTTYSSKTQKLDN